MDEIKVGDFVRTRNGEIYKVDDLNDYDFMRDKFYNNIKNHDSEIIKLVEVGDYVNGEIVIDIGENGLYLGYADDYENYSRISIDKSEIKTIVTKEQFESVEFRLGE